MKKAAHGNIMAQPMTRKRPRVVQDVDHHRNDEGAADSVDPRQQKSQEKIEMKVPGIAVQEGEEKGSDQNGWCFAYVNRK